MKCTVVICGRTQFNAVWSSLVSTSGLYVLSGALQFFSVVFPNQSGSLVSTQEELENLQTGRYEQVPFRVNVEPTRPTSYLATGSP